jgi:hypothetical protein
LSPETPADRKGNMYDFDDIDDFVDLDYSDDVDVDTLAAEYAVDMVGMLSAGADDYDVADDYDY